MSGGLKKIRISLATLTPTSMGGYDTQVHRTGGEGAVDTFLLLPDDSAAELLEPPRPTSIRGVWRWWIRAFAAGAAYDMGLDEVRSAEILAQKILGAAGARAGKGGRSRLQIALKMGEGTTISPKNVVRKDGVLGSISRIRLLRDAPFTAYPTGVKLNLDVLILDEDVEAAFSTLICGLLLGGVGKISRRGFGSLKISDITPVGSGIDWLENWREIIKRINEDNNFEAVRDNLRHIITLAYESVKREVERLPEFGEESRAAKAAEGSDRNIPRVPAMAKKNGVAKVYLAHWNLDAMGSLRLIGDICTRSAIPTFPDNVRLRSLPAKLLNLSNSRESPDTNRVKRYPACILGLPRSVKGTGYRIVSRDSTERRASPLIFKILRTSGRGTFVALTTLSSIDWPEKVSWKGGGGPVDIRIDHTLVTNVMGEIRRHLSQYRFKEVWP